MVNSKTRGELIAYLLNGRERWLRWAAASPRLVQKLSIYAHIADLELSTPAVRMDKVFTEANISLREEIWTTLEVRIVILFAKLKLLTGMAFSYIS